MHSIVSVAQDGSSQSHGHGSGGGGAELEHFGSIDGTSAGQKDTIITPTNHAIIAAIRVNPATRSLNKRLIKAMNNVSAIKYNRLFDFLLLPIFVYTCAV
jgi:hypothetical protein